MALVPSSIWGSSAWNAWVTLADVAVARDGAVWTVDVDRFVTRWHPVYGQPLARVALDGGGAPTNAALLPDDQHMVVGTAGGGLALHSLVTGAARWRKGAVGAPSGGMMPNITSLSVSRDGATIATTAAGEATPSVRFWETKTGAERGLVEDHARRVTILPDGAHALLDGKRIVAIASGETVLEIPGNGSVGACTEDGEKIITGDETGNLACWELTKLREGAREPVWRKVNLDTAGAPARITQVSIDRNGRVLTTSTLRHHVWNISDGRRIEDLHFLGTWRVAYGPDGDRAYGLELQRRRLRQIDFMRHAELRPSFVHEESITAIAVSSDGSTLVTGSRDGIVHLRDPSTGELWAELNTHDEVRALMVTPDGRAVLCCTPSSLVLHAIAGHQRLQHWHAFALKLRALVGAVATPLGTAIVCDESGTAVCLDLATRAETWRRERASAKYLSLAGPRLLVSATSCEVQLWDAKSGETLERHPVPDRKKTQPHVLLDDARALGIHTDRGLVVRELRTGGEVHHFPGSEPCTDVLVASADRRFAVTATPSGDVQLWDLTEGRLSDRLELGASHDRATCAAFARDGRTFFIGTNRGLVMRLPVPGRAQ